MGSVAGDLWRRIVEASTYSYSRTSPQTFATTPALQDADSASLQYAGFWQRFGALMVDGFVLLPLMLSTAWASTESRAWALLLIVPQSVLILGYYVWFHARWGQTPGKMATHVRVVRLDGSPIALRQALLRSAPDIFLGLLSAGARFVSLLQIPAAEYASLGWMGQARRLSEIEGGWQWLGWLQITWVLSEVFTMLFNERRRAIHDFIAGTVVIRTRPKRPGKDLFSS